MHGLAASLRSQSGKVIAQYSAWGRRVSLLPTPWFLADVVSLSPFPANVSPSETPKGSTESQGATSRARRCGQPMPVSGASSRVAAPRALRAFPETVLQHIGLGSQARVLSQLGWQEVPRSIQLWRRDGSWKGAPPGLSRGAVREGRQL